MYIFLTKMSYHFRQSKPRAVYHFHFTGWPDNGIPEAATSLLSFRRKVRSRDDIGKGPIIVHCRWDISRAWILGLYYMIFVAAQCLMSCYNDRDLLWSQWGKSYNRNCKNPVLDAIRTLSTSNRAIYCNLQNTYFSLLIDLDTLIIISSKIDAPYL